MSHETLADDALELMAQLDFERWKQQPGGWTPPTNAEWTSLANPHLISVRLAWLTMHKSREELVGVAKQLTDDGLMELVRQIGLSSDWFKGLHELLLGAECRIMCAYAARHADSANDPDASHL